MKKLMIFGFLIVGLSLLFSSSAFALSCETSQALNGSDACYTKVTVSSLEVNLVSRGTVLVYSVDASTPYQGAYEVRVATASTDNAVVAGFAQTPIASGQSAMILVRGYGYVKTVGGVASRDELFVVASGNAAAWSGNPGHASKYPVAIALETSTSNGTTARRVLARVV